MTYRPLAAGKLDKRVTIQERRSTDDGGGGEDITYADLATVPASVSPGTGREFVNAQQLTPELTHMVVMRYRDGVTPKHRLRYVVRGVSRFLPIHIVSDPDERHEQLVLYCSEVTPT